MSCECFNAHFRDGGNAKKVLMGNNKFRYMLSRHVNGQMWSSLQALPPRCLLVEYCSYIDNTVEITYCTAA
jgi:hypothetical protein